MIRRLTPDDASLLRSLRLRALNESPSAFGSTWKETSERSMSVWQHMLRADGNPFFVFETVEHVHGLIGGFVPEQKGEVHLVSMWIEPTHRGLGVSDELVKHVIEWARSTDEHRVILQCTEGNLRAEKLYFRHGFRRTGMSSTRERDGATEFQMILELNASTQQPN